MLKRKSTVILCAGAISTHAEYGQFGQQAAEHPRRGEALEGKAKIGITWPHQCHVGIEAIVSTIGLIGDLVVAIPQ
jgi:hypothetical protein